MHRVGPGWEVVRAAAAEARDGLGARLASAYAIGSLAHGGFSEAASDVDLALLTEDVAAPDELRRIAQATEATAGTALARRLSIFHAPRGAFGNPPAGARFPALDRLDLVRHGVVLDGADIRAAAPEPTSDEVVAEAVAFGLDRFGSPALRAAIREPALAPGELREVTKLALYPVRLLFVALTADVASNEDAAAYYDRTVGAARLELVGRALEWRRAGAIQDPASAAALLRRELLPLHRQVATLLAGTPGLPRADAFACIEW